jgi:hypothetical protein
MNRLKYFLRVLSILILTFVSVGASFAHVTSISALDLRYKLPWQNGIKATYIRGSKNSNQSLKHTTPGKYDFVVDNGNIAAAKDGTIVYVNDSNTKTVPNSDYWVYWNSVVIKHGTNEYSSYHHLKTGSVPSWIKQACTTTYSKQNCNVAVKAGQVIGIQGNTGNSTGIHLHVQFGTTIAFSNKPDFYDQDKDGNKTEKVYSGYAWNLRDVGFEASDRSYSATEVNKWALQKRLTASHGGQDVISENWTGKEFKGDHGTFFADVTGDKKADAIVSNTYGIVVRKSDGTKFLPNATWTEKEYKGDYGTFFADVTGDGKADAIVANTYGVVVRRSTGTSFSANEKWIDKEFKGDYGTFFADVTGDGKADAIVVNTYGVVVRRSDGSKFLPNEKWIDKEFKGDYGTFFADVTGDGKADAIVANIYGVVVRRSTGTLFSANEKWIDKQYVGAKGNYFADVSGDRKADAIVVNADKIVVRKSDGIKFLPNTTLVNQPFVGNYGNYFVDVTGDGKSDSLAVTTTGVLVVKSN